MKSVVVSTNGSVLAYLGSIVINELHSLATILPMSKTMTLEQIVNPGNKQGEFKLFLVHVKSADELNWRDISWALVNKIKVVIYCNDLLDAQQHPSLFISQVSISDRDAVIQELKKILQNDIVCASQGNRVA